MRALGATVVEDGADFDAAKAAARAYAAARDMRFVEDSRDPEPTIGAGTIGVELLRDGPYDAIVLPVGNGALAAGVGCAVKAAAPATRIIGVCAAAAPAMERSWRTGTVVTTDDANTSADGIAVRVPVPEALTDLAPVLDDFLLVDEDAMLAWVRLAHRHLGVVLEPSGAIGLAAIAANPDRFGGRRVATVLTGGNLSEELMSLWL